MSPELESEVTEIYREHAAGLMRYARTVARDADEARDAVQECFLRYCLERRFGRTIDTPRAWLFQVLRNHLLTKWNSAAETREVMTAELDSLGDERSNPEKLADREQQARAIRERLTNREFECLRLRAEGLSYAEIGRHLDIRSGTVGALLARVVEKLRWPPGRQGTIGLRTAEAVHSLLFGATPCSTPTLNR